MKYLILSILLSGCSVTKYQMDTADDLCECNGGVSMYVVGADYEIRCMNGAQFKDD